jgi:hypothetical protein
MALQFEVRKVALKQDRTGFILTLCIHPDEIPEELLRDFVGARYGCALVRIQDDESPTEYNNRVQQAAILCKRENFWHFIGATGEGEAAAVLCDMLEIESRAELNGNKRAQELFDDLVKRYEALNDPF